MCGPLTPHNLFYIYALPFRYTVCISSIRHQLPSPSFLSSLFVHGSGRDTPTVATMEHEHSGPAVKAVSNKQSCDHLEQGETPPATGRMGTLLAVALTLLLGT